MTKCCRVLCERLHIWADENIPRELVCRVNHRNMDKAQGKGAEKQNLSQVIGFRSSGPAIPGTAPKLPWLPGQGKSSMSELFLNTLIAGRYPEMPSFGLGLVTYNKGKYWWLSSSLWPNTWKETTSGRFESRVHHSRGVPVDRQTGCSYGYRSIRTLVHTPADQGTENKVFSCAFGFLFLSCLQSPFGSWDIATHM